MFSFTPTNFSTLPFSTYLTFHTPFDAVKLFLTVTKPWLNPRSTKLSEYTVITLIKITERLRVRDGIHWENNDNDRKRIRVHGILWRFCVCVVESSAERSVSPKKYYEYNFERKLQYLIDDVFPSPSLPFVIQLVFVFIQSVNGT